jgi:hypothetical protein
MYDLSCLLKTVLLGLLLCDMFVALWILSAVILPGHTANNNLAAQSYKPHNKATYMLTGCTEAAKLRIATAARLRASSVIISHQSSSVRAPSVSVWTPEFVIWIPQLDL